MESLIFFIWYYGVVMGLTYYSIFFSYWVLQTMEHPLELAVELKRMLYVINSIHIIAYIVLSLISFESLFMCRLFEN